MNLETILTQRFGVTIDVIPPTIYAHVPTLKESNQVTQWLLENGFDFELRGEWIDIPAVAFIDYYRLIGQI